MGRCTWIVNDPGEPMVYDTNMIITYLYCFVKVLLIRVLSSTVSYYYYYRFVLTHKFK